jgi:Tfp pilus assembly protein PilX
MQYLFLLKRKLFNRKREFYCLPINNNSGKALLMVLMSSVVTATIALSAFKFSSLDAKRTRKYIESRQAFYLAEAGLQKALNYLQYNSEGDYPGDIGEEGFTSVLTSFVSNHEEDLVDYSLGEGSYTVSVVDNDDGDDDTSTDLDNVIFINSTGIKNDKSSSIEALVTHDVSNKMVTVLSWKEK